MKNPSLTISRVEPGSPAALKGIRKGDALLTVNGHPMRDIIDYRYYADEGPLVCVFSSKGKEKTVTFSSSEPSGLDFEPFSIMRCGNRCVFCFIDQNPQGLRKSLYVKDEDYRLSFLHGNYVTMTRIGKAEIERIVSQRLSPLYVSIHALDPDVRKRLLGLKKDDHLLDKIRILLDNHIELHGQIVLCPGWNDGRVLEETIDGLEPLYPGLKTLAVVPVGLSKHREGLPSLKGVTSEAARALIKQYRRMQKRNLRKWGEPFLYFSDEFYLLAGTGLPSLDHYGGLHQIENGVGLTSYFLERFKAAAKNFPSKAGSKRRITLITGRLAEPLFLRHVRQRLRRIKNLDITVLGVENRLHGEAVTVAGLLSGQDILNALKEAEASGVVLLPPSCLNTDGRFLDNMVPEAIEKALHVDLHILDDWDNFVELLK